MTESADHPEPAPDDSKLPRELDQGLAFAYGEAAPSEVAPSVLAFAMLLEGIDLEKHKIRKSFARECAMTHDRGRCNDRRGERASQGHRHAAQADPGAGWPSHGRRARCVRGGWVGVVSGAARTVPGSDPGIRWSGQHVFVGEAFAGELIALRQVEDDRWHVHLGPLRLGVLHERSRTIVLLEPSVTHVPGHAEP